MFELEITWYEYISLVEDNLLLNKVLNRNKEIEDNFHQNKHIVCVFKHIFVSKECIYIFIE